MDFIEKLNNLSNHIVDYKDQVKGERATINAFILPFIRLLGYDDAKPTEVKHEYTADIGTKQREKIDLAILKDGKVIMLIECKNWRSDLSKADVSQLYRYFNAVTEARIGVLTNGVLYRFYTDAEKPNVLDSTTFFEFNMHEIQPPSVNVLNYFTKNNFDLDHIHSTAIDLKYRGEIKQILEKQLKTPTNDFVEFFHNAIKSQMEVQDFKDVVKRAFNEFMDEHNKHDPNKSDEQDRKKPNGSKKPLAKDTNLRVTMSDGTVIHHFHATKTYLEVLEKIGLEKVAEVRSNIVSKKPFAGKDKGIQQGEFWIRGTTAGFGTQEKKDELEKIADLIPVSLHVERVKKKSKSG